MCCVCVVCVWVDSMCTGFVGPVGRTFVSLNPKPLTPTLSFISTITLPTPPPSRPLPHTCCPPLNRTSPHTLCRFDGAVMACFPITSIPSHLAGSGPKVDRDGGRAGDRVEGVPHGVRGAVVVGRTHLVRVLLGQRVPVLGRVHEAGTPALGAAHQQISPRCSLSQISFLIYIPPFLTFITVRLLGRHSRAMQLYLVYVSK